MADSITINYSWTMPEVGGSPDSWGTKLNSTITAIDARMKLVSDSAAAAQSVANQALPATLFTGPNILVRLAAVDGPGSGLDADFFDSQDSSFYRNASNLNAGLVADGVMQGKYLRHASLGSGLISVGSGSPSGGNSGDIYLQIA